MTGNEKRGGRAAEGVGMEGWGRKVKVVGRSDGDLMGARKDGGERKAGSRGVKTGERAREVGRRMR